MFTVATYILSNVYGIGGQGLIYLFTAIFDFAIIALIEKFINKE